jgi:monoamine oxidase
MGTNSKLHVQFADRHWESLDCNGETFADTGYQNTWDVSRAQPGASGILVNYTGGNIGASFGSGTPTTRAQQFLAQIEPVLPGLSDRWNGKATIDFAREQWTKAVLLLEGRPVHTVRGHRGQAGGQLPLRGRAHLD